MKKTITVFNKKNYYLGSDKDGINYRLKTPSRDCGHYRGFGYVTTYTNNKQPEKSRDIASHSHVDSKDCRGGESIFTGKFLIKKSFNGKEGRQLRELFEQFYHYKDHAGLMDRGNTNITTIEGLNHSNKFEYQRINKEILPLIMAKIICILDETAHYETTVGFMSDKCIFKD